MTAEIYLSLILNVPALFDRLYSFLRREDVFMHRRVCRSFQRRYKKYEVRVTRTIGEHADVCAMLNRNNTSLAQDEIFASLSSLHLPVPMYSVKQESRLTTSDSLPL
jgi:hypothetical protein